MNFTFNHRLLVLLACLLIGPSAHLLAQTEEQKLTASILHLDSAFWNSYNSCDTAAFKNFVADDVEFYHDKGGITMGAHSLIESLKKNICGGENRIRREAIASTVHVYPMHSGNEIYGALISGEHLFYITEKGKREKLTGHASFTQLWQMKNGVWKMTRILSYNHHEAEYENKRKEIVLPLKQLDQFIGNYRSSKSGTMTVTRDNKTLVLKGGSNSYILYPMTNNSFFTKERDLVFEFVKDGKVKVVKMVVKENGVMEDELGMVR
jgi:hypothetical protein